MKGKWGEDGDTLARSLRIQGVGEGRPGGGRNRQKAGGGKAAMMLFFFLGCLFDVA